MFLNQKPASASPPLRLETDSNGEARFAIPETMADHLDVRVVTKSGNWHCACRVIAEAETAIHTGIVESAYGQLKPPITVPEAEAGSMVFVLRPYSWWERLIAPLMRQ